ncbi:MAG: 2OG-Fe(II) oxygenase [Comamonadaceae bacterium]|nr:MAG: 2OG-Fe(II) oxygenase [Comamonadaceae bacterium]
MDAAWTSQAHQGGLFGADAAALEPAGLAYLPDFLTRTEEDDLMALLATLPLQNAAYKQYTARRRVTSFGHSYDYDANVLRDAPAIPAAFDRVRARVAAWAGVEAADFAQLLVAEYAPGTPLGWHRDVPDYELVAGVSLGTAATLRFRPYPHRPGTKSVLRDVEVAPRSVYSMRGPARWDWQHCVLPTPGHRFSLTFRTRSNRRMNAEPGFPA